MRAQTEIPLGKTFRKLSGSSQETPSKLSGDDFSEPAGSRVGPLPPALRRTRKLPRGVSSQEALRKLSGSFQEALRRLSGSSQEALRKLSGDSLKP